MGSGVGVFQVETQRKKSRLLQRHEGREGRVTSQTGNQKGSLRTISCAWTFSVNGGKPGEVSKPESGMSVCSMDNG